MRPRTSRQRPLPQLPHLCVHLPLHGPGLAERRVKLAVHLRKSVTKGTLCSGLSTSRINMWVAVGGGSMEGGRTLWGDSMTAGPQW